MRLKREAVEQLMSGRPPGTRPEDVLEVEVYILDDVSGKRIAIAPAALKAKYRSA